MHVVPRKDMSCVVFDAQVVELVDTLASGASARKGVEVRVFFWAPIKAIYKPVYVASKTRF